MTASAVALSARLLDVLRPPSAIGGTLSRMQGIAPGKKDSEALLLLLEGCWLLGASLALVVSPEMIAPADFRLSCFCTPGIEV